MTNLRSTFLFCLVASFLLIFSLTIFINLFLDEDNLAIEKTHAEEETQKYVEEVIEIENGDDVEFLVNNKLEVEEELPDFARFETQRLFLEPNKTQTGEYEIRLIDKSTKETSKVLSINLTKDEFDAKALEAELFESMGEFKNNYGIYIKDLLTGQVYSYQSEKEFPSASISKLPAVALTLRDIDKGKIDYDSLITVEDRYKHSTFDSIGSLPAGTKVPVSDLMRYAIIESNNSAHYHLQEVVLDGIGGVNPRTQKELGVENLFLNPLTAEAKSVGDLYEGIYFRETLSDESAKYFFDTLLSAYPDLRAGIPGGVPETDVVKAANKPGFLFGGEYGETYADSGLVFGKNTDYIVVFLNDRAPMPFPDGWRKIREMSSIVYKYLDI